MVRHKDIDKKHFCSCERYWKMRILITGVAGFIGSNLAEYLINKGYDIVGIDDLSYGVIEQIPSQTEFHKIDILSEKIYPLFKDIDVVFHLAAKNSIPDCQRPTWYSSNKYTRFSMNVFEACRNASFRRIIYAESSAIYEGSKSIQHRKMIPIHYHFMQ